MSIVGKRANVHIALLDDLALMSCILPADIIWVNVLKQPISAYSASSILSLFAVIYACVKRYVGYVLLQYFIHRSIYNNESLNL